MASSFVQRYDRARQGCALFHLEDWAVFELSGPDTRDFLQRLSTADLKDLAAGCGKQTLFLQGDGRIVADCAVLCESSELFRLACPATCRDGLAELLDRFLFAEKVTVSDVSDKWYVAHVAGPSRGAFAASVQDICDEAKVVCQQSEVLFAPASGRIVLMMERSGFQSQREAVYDSLENVGGIHGDQDLFETFRIEEGWPFFGKDTSSKTIPLEANQTASISFTKGCFPGQEIVARINNLGHPANVLVGLLVAETGEDLSGKELKAGDKVVGVITSSCYSPAVRGPLALGFVKWKFREPEQVLEIAGSDGLTTAVTSLPLAGLEP